MIQRQNTDLRILIIEDSEPDRMMLQRALRALRFSVDEAVDGATARDRVRNNSYDCILIDFRLPDCDGTELLDEFVTLPRSPACIMMSGMGDETLAVETLKRGAQDYVPKSHISEEVLKRAITQAVDKHRLQREVRSNRERLALFYQLIDSLQDLLVIMDASDSRVVEINAAALDKLGYNKVSVVGDPASGRLFRPQIAPGKDQSWDSFADGLRRSNTALLEWPLLHSNGREIPAEINARYVSVGNSDYVVAAIRDISHHHAQRQVLESESRNDALTGILNRRGFDETLQNLWAAHIQSNNPLALLMIDIDHFKRYNDSAGHPAGDRCLQQVAGILAGALRSTDVATRYGGEEFALLLPFTDRDGAETMANNIHRSLARAAIPHPGLENNAPLTLSIGIAVTTPQQESSAAALISAADGALYQAKQAGRSCSRVA